MDDGNLVILVIVSTISIICNIAAAHHKSGPSMAAIPLQIAVLWFGFQWNGLLGLAAAFVIANFVAIILCQTVFKQSIAKVQGGY